MIRKRSIDLQPPVPENITGRAFLNGVLKSLEPSGSRFRHIVFSDSLRAMRRNADFAMRLDRRPVAEPFSAARPEDDSFLRWMLEKAGLDATKYRLETLRRRLPSVLRGLHATSSGDARSAVQRDLSLLPTALSAAIIGVTSFFREPAVFELLRTRVLAELAASRRLRIWSLGCSEGAELFSIAILLDELGQLGNCELLGTDCRSDAILAAREGAFDAHTIKDVDVERRRRYFELHPPRWRVTDRLRRAASWQLGNGLAYVERGPWDLILCRNLAIYLQNDAITALWRRLTGALRPGGYLVVGKAERPNDAKELTMIGPCVYRRESI